jgi:hypothetical protein
MTTPDTLYESLALTPNDWDTRAILADWYEESGQQFAADSIHWMIARQKRPYKSTAGTFHWFNAERVTTAADPESDIPEAVYKQMKGKEGLEMVFRDYESIRAADEDFHSAWHKACEEGWDSDA